ncbi:FAD-dependent oxidoreductase [Clostridium grantii]|uniref:Thioredoxin reductase (NADPH) n=1 Tax=Clostridium grantii DSM 8605 TaxID=1121316 RepID=A0A1M5VZX0_9CLOT|nr:FAD-dependent oxidoreductase [Clostridium grantii]SHH80761.1 thioredoxin reductase (NADPH) [Clostridium grantii DSM 8605]
MSENIKTIDATEFQSEVIESLKPVVLEFYSEGCPPCEVLSPIYTRLNERYGNQIKFVKILRTANKDFGLSLNVLSSPTLLFFNKGKEVGTRLTGFLSLVEVRKVFEDVFKQMLPTIERKKVYCDLIILGAGVAGLSAAIYASRAGLKTILIDENVIGGQTATLYNVENYPGSKGCIKGKILIENMKNQAISFGTLIKDLKEILKVDLISEIKYVRTEDTDFYAKSIIIASGAKPKQLPAKNAHTFMGKGIHYCATCDAPMYKDKKIVVIGGGNSALEEAVLLCKYASEVTIIHQFDKFQAGNKAIKEVLNKDKISVILNSEVREVKGKDKRLQFIVIENLITKKIMEISTEGVFVYIGSEPKSELYKNQINLDQLGYIIANEDTKTNLEGVFAAGDIRTKQVRQIITAASDGAISAVMAERFIKNIK